MKLSDFWTETVETETHYIDAEETEEEWRAGVRRVGEWLDRVTCAALWLIVVFGGGGWILAWVMTR